jgi:FMN phosphatase YigB (HAD superfamily)
MMMAESASESSKSHLRTLSSPMKEKIAIIDVDGTLYQDATRIEQQIAINIAKYSSKLGLSKEKRYRSLRDSLPLHAM